MVNFMVWMHMLSMRRGQLDRAIKLYDEIRRVPRRASSNGRLIGFRHGGACGFLYCIFPPARKLFSRKLWTRTCTQPPSYSGKGRIVYRPQPTCITQLWWISTGLLSNLGRAGSGRLHHNLTDSRTPDFQPASQDRKKIDSRTLPI